MSDHEELLNRMRRTARTMYQLGSAMDISDFDIGDTERAIASLLDEAADALRTTVDGEAALQTMIDGCRELVVEWSDNPPDSDAYEELAAIVGWPPRSDT